MKQIKFDSFIVIDIGIFCLSYNVFSYIFHINKEGRHCNIEFKQRDCNTWSCDTIYIIFWCVLHFGPAKYYNWFYLTIIFTCVKLRIFFTIWCHHASSNLIIFFCLDDMKRVATTRSPLLLQPRLLKMKKKNLKRLVNVLTYQGSYLGPSIYYLPSSIRIND